MSASKPSKHPAPGASCAGDAGPGRSGEAQQSSPVPEDDHDKSSRCLLVRAGRVLLVTHSNCSAPNRGKWALPGGRLEDGESPRRTLRRELLEELDLEIEVLHEVGRYISRQRWHRVYWADCAQGPERWDPSEIDEARWFDPPDVVALESAGQLHYGFEAAVVNDWIESVRHRKSPSPDSAGSDEIAEDRPQG